jgi:hypothetical protein
MKRLVLITMLLPLWVQAAEPQSAPTREEFMALKAEIDQLRALLPTQAHTMVDVEHQFANAWFAAKAGNWPLAKFYVNETRGRVTWTVRIRPVRKSEAGEDIVLAPLAQALETAGFVPLRAAIEARNRKDFEAAYRSALKACYGCHVAVEKPQLRPEIPHMPGTLLIDMKPDAR